MNQLETNIRSIMFNALVAVMREVQSSTMADIGAAFSDEDAKPAHQLARRALRAIPPRRPTKRGPRLSAQEALPKALQFIAHATDPVLITDVANALGFTTDAAKRVIKKLREDKQVVMHGSRRAARYTANDVPGTAITNPQAVLGPNAIPKRRKPTKRANARA